MTPITMLCSAGVGRPELANRLRRQASFKRYQTFLAKHPNHFIAPRQTQDLDTAWLSYCFLVHPDAGFTRSDLQAYLEPRGIDTGVVWTGNAARQPMVKAANFRFPPDGLPNADRVMEFGILLPCGQTLTGRRH